MNINFNENMKINDNIELPLNIIKQKIEFCLPPNTEIDDLAIIAINRSLNFFLKDFAKSIKYENGKIKMKHIKTTIDNGKKFEFLRKLK